MNRIKAIVDKPLGSFLRVTRLWHCYRQKKRSLMHVAQLPDHLLKDIGLERVDLEKMGYECQCTESKRQLMRLLHDR